MHYFPQGTIEFTMWLFLPSLASADINNKISSANYCRRCKYECVCMRAGNGEGFLWKADDGVDDKGRVWSAVYDVPPDSLHFFLIVLCWCLIPTKGVREIVGKKTGEKGEKNADGGVAVVVEEEEAGKSHECSLQNRWQREEGRGEKEENCQLSGCCGN